MRERLRSVFNRRTLKDDAMAGLVLGVESVPDGLANGLLAGVNPVAGLYGYMYGAMSATFFTGTAYMAVQGTGAMAMIVADVGAVHNAEDPAKALFTLSIVTGLVMILAGYFKLGFLLRFVSNSVMVGFISAVGVNIVLGQVEDFTGYESEGANRVTRALDTLVHFWEIHLPTFTVGVITIALIILLRRTPLGSLGLVVAIVVGSVVAAVFNTFDQAVAVLGDIADVPNALPFITLPVISDIPDLVVPAVSLAFVGLVQGAGVTSTFPNRDGSFGDASEDFVGQGVGNVTSGLFQGVPVGGSVSATALVVSAGAKSRSALVITGGVMAAVILLFSGVVEVTAMPALAGLLIVIGVETVNVRSIIEVYNTGTIQTAVMGVTFVLTLLIPLQSAVLVGIALSMLLYIIRQSNQLDTKRLLFDDQGRVKEEEPPDVVGAGDVVVIQPYGSLFFAAAPTFEEALPSVVESSRGSVVIIRLRGKSDIGSTLVDVLERYAESLTEVGSKLMIVTDSDRIVEQVTDTGVVDAIGERNLYRATEYLLETTTQATNDAHRWIEQQQALPDEEPSADE